MQNIAINHIITYKNDLNSKTAWLVYLFAPADYRLFLPQVLPNVLDFLY